MQTRATQNDWTVADFGECDDRPTEAAQPLSRSAAHSITDADQDRVGRALARLYMRAAELAQAEETKEKAASGQLAAGTEGVGVKGDDFRAMEVRLRQ